MEMILCDRRGFEISENECIIRQRASRHFDNGCRGCAQGEKNVMVNKKDPTGLNCKRCKKSATEVKIFNYKRGMCHSCVVYEGQKSKEKEGEASVEASTKEESPPQPETKKEVKPMEETGENVVTIDLSDYPELLDRVRKEARDDVRTPELQIIFLIKAAFNALPESL